MICERVSKPQAPSRFCLAVFPWAHFGTTKAAVKMHTLLDLRGNIPSFIHVSDSKLHDVHALDPRFCEGRLCAPGGRRDLRHGSGLCRRFRPAPCVASRPTLPVRRRVRALRGAGPFSDRIESSVPSAVLQVLRWRRRSAALRSTEQGAIRRAQFYAPVTFRGCVRCSTVRSSSSRKVGRFDARLGYPPPGADQR
jgi:hypothetical protein